MIQIYADNAKLTAQKLETVTSGASKSFEVEITFSEEWSTLSRTVVFKAGEKAVSVIPSEDNRCIIPWEVLTKPGYILNVGVYGTQDGNVVLPTVWCAIGEIRTGTELGENGAEPTPDIVRQIMAAAGNAVNIAKSANDTAESAVKSAKNANDTAESAVQSAENANDTAESAVISAKNANDTAESAVQTADKADEAAQTALETARESNVLATSAVEKANSAVETASNSEAVSTEAKATAEEAKNIAQSASEKATAAVSSAQSAVDTAQQAVDTANSAIEASRGAVASAENAVKASENAVNVANEAGTKADTAIEASGEASAAAQNAVETADNANQTAQAAEEKAEAAVASAKTAESAAAGAVSKSEAALETAKNVVDAANNAFLIAESAREISESADTAAQGAVTAAKGAVSAAESAKEIAVSADNSAKASASSAAESVVQATAAADYAAEVKTAVESGALKGEKGDKGEDGADGVNGQDGADGKDFTYDMFTPEQLAALKGEKGDKGEDGADGKDFTYDMFTPEQLAALKGEKGDKGEDGADGYTPVKGTDYFTDEDKAELVADLKIEVAYSGAGYHNSIYRGKYLGEEFTTAQDIAIQNGTFDDLYIGDYWTIGGVNYRIAAFDYYLGTGDTPCEEHHVTIVPDKSLYSYVMNDDNVTTGAYVGSKMYTEGLTEAKTIIDDAFGGNILNHRQFLKNTVSDEGYETGGDWYDSTVELMTEQNVFGSRFYGNAMCAGIACFKTLDSVQYPLFALNRKMLISGGTIHLRDVVAPTNFSVVTLNGLPDFHGASAIGGVRPSFSIYGSINSAT